MNEINSYYKINKSIYNSFECEQNIGIFAEFCYCAHSDNDHNDSDNRCKKENCNCLGFLP